MTFFSSLSLWCLVGDLKNHKDGNDSVGGKDAFERRRRAPLLTSQVLLTQTVDLLNFNDLVPS